MRPSVISLFSGAGGFDHGFHAAGYDVRLAAEIDPICCATLRTADLWRVFEGDVNQLTCDELRVLAGVKGSPDVLIGGPPCQPFSKSGWWATGDSRRLRDPRAATLRGYFRLLETLMRQLLGTEPVGKLKLSISVRRPIPPAEPVASVPRRYRSLVGHYSAHPGTGKGALYDRPPTKAA